MYRLEELQDLVSNRIKHLSFEKEPRELYEPIAYTLHSGGKRIRPALVLAACNLFSDDTEPAVKPALGFEVFHNFTLIHDDIMDNSDKRRNRLTVHKKWDSNRAILSGDAMMTEAYRLIAQSPDKTLKPVLDIFNQTALEVCEGQQYDINFESIDAVQIPEYMKMIRLKTAVLLAACLKAGAVIGGAALADADRLYEFGIELGLAFQLQDDLLDVYADEKAFGKPVGGDIAEGKKTILYLEALRKLNESDCEQFTSLFADEMIQREDKISKVRSLYDKYQLANHVSERMNGHYQKALSALENVSVPEARKTVLSDFAKKIMNRKS
jgi:geranylgeranyl diphosphate synthase, type II